MSDDTISRQATIDAIEHHEKAVLEGLEVDENIAYGYAAAHIHLVEIVRKLPSAERRGQWIDGKCSICEADAPYTEDGFWAETPYCPNCGSFNGKDNLNEKL